MNTIIIITTIWLACLWLLKQALRLKSIPIRVIVVGFVGFQLFVWTLALVHAIAYVNS